VCQTCSQDRQLPEPKGMWYGCVIRCRRLPWRFPGRATLSAPKGDTPIREMRPSGAAPTSPPEEVLRHMRHQQLWLAVGTHYGPTRIYGPTAMPSEGRHSRHSGASTAAAMQPADEDRSDAVRRDRRLCDCRSEAMRQSGSTDSECSASQPDAACAGYLLF
jgi:hypothetical protein